MSSITYRDSRYDLLIGLQTDQEIPNEAERALWLVIRTPTKEALINLFAEKHSTTVASALNEVYEMLTRGPTGAPGQRH